MGSHDPFGHFKTQVMIKRKTTKSRELPQFPYMQAACNISLESSQQRLQIYFKPHLNLRSTHKVMVPQSCKKPNFGNIRTPIWESQNKMTFGCRSHGQAHSIISGGRWWLPPNLGHGESYESVLACDLSMHQKHSKYALTNLCLGLCKYM